MDSSKQPIKSSSEEIDLFELFKSFLFTIKHNSVTIIVTFFIGIALGWSYYQFSPKVFESKMLILGESYTKSLIDNIDKLIKEQNTQVLSEKLSLPIEEASKIIGVKLLSTMEKLGEKPEDTKTYFTIGVEMRDNVTWASLQNGLMYYFKNNEFVKIQAAQKKKYVDQIVDQINTELADLQKLKETRADAGAQSNKQSLVLFDPTNVNSKILELSKEKILLQNSLESLNNVQIVEGFTVFKKPASPRLFSSLASGALFGLFIAFMIIVSKVIRSILSQE